MGLFDREGTDEGDPDELRFDLTGDGDRSASLEQAFGAARRRGAVVEERRADRSLEVHPDLDEDGFFETVDGHTTITNRYDLEKTVPQAKKDHFREIERYWVNKPYALVVIFKSEKENETKYYVIEPHLSPIEEEMREFLDQKLRTAIKFREDDVLEEAGADKAAVIERETRRLLERYGLLTDDEEDGFDWGGLLKLGGLFGNGADPEPEERTSNEADETTGPIPGNTARPEPALIEEDRDTLTEYQVRKLLYYLKRDFVGYERIDAIKHDVAHVEDISCDGYNRPVFVYHSEYENIITNIYHGEEELDDFVVKLAQRSGKGISKRQPQVDATLPDGSRSQLTLGKEVSDHGTNYTIRQFKDVPFTPIDEINWHTFSLEETAFLWLAIENEKSLIMAGGTATGKTAALNAMSLFIPSNSKIVSIEDTREVELPQRNWIASVTRPSFSDDDAGDIDEFDLLEAALRQRPDYIVMGEVRGEEGRDLFQVMSTGHTSYTTFHADSVGEVLKRFTTDPINVSKTLFTALDLVSIQIQTRHRGRKVRKSENITEINEYNAEKDEINVRDIFQWRADTDTFEQVGRSSVLNEIKSERGWDQERLEEELFKRRVVLSYLIDRDLRTYTQVAATIQSFIGDPDTTLGLIANDSLEANLDDLRDMESVDINIDPETEALVPRPDPGEPALEVSERTLEEAEDRLFPEYRDEEPTALDFERALSATGEEADDIPLDAGDDDGGGAAGTVEEAE